MCLFHYLTNLHIPPTSPLTVGYIPQTGITEAVRITVFVDNVNDNSPVFTSSDYQITLTSDDTAGLNVLKVSVCEVLYFMCLMSQYVQSSC